MPRLAAVAEPAVASRTRLALAAASLTAALAALALVGWWLDMPRLRSLLPVPWQMNPMTATAHLLLASGVIGLARSREEGRAPLSRAAGGLAATVGAVQLAAHLTERVPRLDLLLFPERVEAAMRGAGAGLSVESASGFLLLGVALAVGRRKERFGLQPAELLALVPLLVAFFSLVRFSYRTQPWTGGQAAYLPMAPSTALAFFAAGLGLLAALPAGRLAGDLWAASDAGRALRRLLGGTLSVLLAAGFLRLEGERAGFYASDFGATLMVLVASVLIGILLWTQARAQQRAEDARRTAEAEREQARRDLEHHLGEVEALNRELEAFSYSVSHDLRAPLRAIDGFSRMLEEDHGPRLDAEARRLLEVVRERARHMGRLIDDLLRFSRLSRQALELRPVDTSRLVAGLLEGLRERIAEGGAQVVCGALPAAMGDPDLLRQVWANYLDNALKYSAGQERPRVDVGGEERDGELVYAVRDNGVGFDMAHSDQLFRVFQRLHRPEEFPGTGVGLALVQRIVHRHGGRVWAEGEPGRGATFFFSLPGEPAGKERSER